MLGAQFEFESLCVWLMHPMSCILKALQNKRTLLGNVMRRSKLRKKVFDSYKSLRCNQALCVFKNKVCACCLLVFLHRMPTFVLGKGSIAYVGTFHTSNIKAMK